MHIAGNKSLAEGFGICEKRRMLQVEQQIRLDSVDYEQMRLAN